MMKISSFSWKFIQRIKPLNGFSSQRLFNSHARYEFSYPLTRNRLCSVNLKNVRHISTTNSLNVEKTTPGLIELLNNNSFVDALKENLIHFHDFTGLTWWSTIIITGFTVRTLLIFPLAIYQHHISARLELVTKELNTTVKEEVTKYVNDMSEKKNWNSEMMKKYYNNLMRRKREELIVNYNCHPAKTSVMLFIQAPVWITLSAALRKLIILKETSSLEDQVAFLEMKASSILWLSDLTTSDSTMTLPFIIGFSNLTILQINHMVRKGETSFGKPLLNILRLCTLGITYLSIQAPACISLYWATSSFYGLCQNILLWNPKVRTFFRIPKTDSVQKEPISHLIKKFKQVFYFLRY